MAHPAQRPLASPSYHTSVQSLASADPPTPWIGKEESFGLVSEEQKLAHFLVGEAFGKLPQTGPRMSSPKTSRGISSPILVL